MSEYQKPAVSIVVTDNFSPFHYAVPNILFDSEVLRDDKLFEVFYCGEQTREYHSQGNTFSLKTDRTLKQTGD